MKLKKIYISLICLILCLVMTVGFCACGSHTLDSAKFLISTSELSADSQEFAVVNRASEKAYVRFDVILTWESTSNKYEVYAASPIRDTDYSIALCEGVIEIGDFFYVCSPIDAGNIADMITVTYLDNAPDGYKLGVKILPDAISAEHPDEVTAAWGVKLDSNKNITK